MDLFPVPMRECRDFDVNYALLENGRVMFHFPDTDSFAPMSHADYEQFEAAYPDEIQLYCPDESDEEEAGMEEDVGEDEEEVEVIYLHDLEEDLEQYINGEDEEFDDASSEASSEFISNPDEQQDDATDDDNLIISPFKRPSNPEPSARRDQHAYADEDTDLEESEEGSEEESDEEHSEEEQSDDEQSDDEQTDDEESADEQSDDEDDDEDDEPISADAPIDDPIPADEPTYADEPITTRRPAIPTSPYRHRATEYSWTGFERTEWGRINYITSDGTMAVRRDWEVESGVSHGRLQRCTWGGCTDRDVIEQPWGEGAPELKLTTPEGVDYWIEDPLEDYYEFDVVYEPWKRLGHRCDERCEWFYRQFPPQEDEEEPQQELKVESREELKEEPKKEEGMTLADLMDEFEGTTTTGGDDEEVNRHSGYSSARIKQCAVQLLATISEEDDFTSADESEQEQGDWLDNLEKAVDEECAVRKQAAETIVQQEEDQGMQGAADEEEVVEETQVEAVPVVEEKRVPRWIREPLFVSRRPWADLDDEEDEEY